MDILHPTSPHAPSSHGSTQVDSANTQLLSSLSRYSFKHDSPPSCVRSKPISSSGQRRRPNNDTISLQRCPLFSTHFGSRVDILAPTPMRPAALPCGLVASQAWLHDSHLAKILAIALTEPVFRLTIIAHVAAFTFYVISPAPSQPA